jgi:hypothetical protein
MSVSFRPLLAVLVKTLNTSFFKSSRALPRGVLLLKHRGSPRNGFFSSNHAGSPRGVFLAPDSCLLSSSPQLHQASFLVLLGLACIAAPIVNLQPFLVTRIRVDSERFIGRRKRVWVSR